MPVYALPEEIAFPSPELAEPGGLLAAGGDLGLERLLLAYANGIFPWPHEGHPLLWFSPEERMVLPPGQAHLPRRLARRIRRRDLRFSLDRDFDRVIQTCAEIPRKRESGTWITPEMIEAYRALHRAGFAHSVEAWSGDELVAGLYGVAIGRVFTGESMFTTESGASKIALLTLLAQLELWEFDLFDAQIHTAHVEQLGGRLWTRVRFLERLRQSGIEASRIGRWRLDPRLEQGPPARGLRAPERGALE